jgi:hypothetical protein
MPQDFLHDLDDPSKANEFIQNAGLSPGTSEMNRARVASQLYLAHKTKSAGESVAASMTTLAEALKAGLNNHANALREAVKSSDKHARWLNWATWALVAVAVVQILVALGVIHR